MSAAVASDHGTMIVLGPLPGSTRLQLRRLLSHIPGTRIVGQAFSLQQLHGLLETQTSCCLLLSGRQDVQAVWPLPACVRVCVLLDGSASVTASNEGRLYPLMCPDELEKVQLGDAFFLALCRALGAAPVGALELSPAVHGAPAPKALKNAVHNRDFQILAIGASTGGPDALAAVLQPLAGRLSVPVVVTQHIGAGFSAALAQSLSQRCQLPVHEARDGQVLQAGQVYLAPASRHLQVRAQHSQLLARIGDGPPECFCKPSVDTMLRSLADVPGLRSLVVILTGMGQDGLEGSRLIRQQGGSILAQDQASSVVWGMPGAVVGANLCEAVLPPPALALHALRLLGADA